MSSYIQSQSQLPYELHFVDGSIGESNLTVQKAWRDVFTDEFTLSTDGLTNTLQFETEFQDSFEYSGFFKSDEDEPNILLSSEFLIEMDSNAELPLRQAFKTNISINIQAEATFSVRETEKVEVSFIVEVLAAQVSGSYREFHARLLINENEIPLTEVTIDAPTNSVGNTINVTLARPGDHTLIVVDTPYTLEIGERVNGVIVWKHRVDSDTFNSKNYGISFSSNAPSDSINLSTPSSLIDKLNKYPLTNEVYYDPLAIELNVDEFEQVYDTSGNAYPTLIFPTSDLTVHDLLEKIFVEKCGFSEYKTNLPDYKTKRLDCSMFESYLSAIGGVIGIFEPLFFEKDDIIWIIDTTAILPPGFPDPRTITGSNYSTLGNSKQNDPIEAYEVSYSEDLLNWDYFTLDTKTDTTVSGTVGGFDFITNEVVTKTREYRRNSAPNIIVSTSIDSIETTQTETFGKVLSTILEEFTYDFLGRETKRVTTSEQRIPRYVQGLVSESLEVVNKSTTKTTYRQHPYEPNKQYKSKVEHTVEGLRYVDPDPYLEDKEYIQRYTDAHLSGNIVESGTSNFGQISSRVETTTPLPNRESKLKVQEIDYLTEPPLLVVNTVDIAVGDIGISSTLPRQKKIIVTLDPELVITDRRKGRLNIGDMPISLGMALAIRLLNKRKFKNHQLSMNLVNIDWNIRRGSLIKALGRNNEDLGNFLIEGFQIVMKSLGVAGEQDVSMSITGTQV